MEDSSLVLHVDDDPTAREEVTEALSGAVPSATSLGVDGVEAARDRLAETEVEAVITAYDLPDGTGLDLLEHVRDRFRNLPVVLFTGSGDESVASRAISANVTGYVRRGAPDAPERVGAAIESALTAGPAGTDNEDGDRDDRSPSSAAEVAEALGGALTEGTEALPTPFELLGDPVYILDADGHLVSVNAAFEEAFGYDRSDLVGSHLTEYVDERTYEEGTAALLDAVEAEGRRHTGLEFTGETADGTEAVVEVTATPVTEDGRLVGSVGTFRDVTERDRRERTLETYRTLVETVSDPMFKLDAAGTIEMVNDAMVEFAGYDREELIGLHFTEFLDAEEAEVGERIARELLSEDGDGTAIHEFSSTTKDGERKVVENGLTVLTDENDRYAGSVGVLRDVTDRKERERELAQYETLMETVPLGMFTVDENGVLTWVNEECYELLDIEEAEAEERYIGESYLNLVEDGYFDPELVERYGEYVGEILSSDTETRKAIHDVHVHRGNGETRIVDAHSGLLPLEDGEFRGTVTAFRDVTKQKEYERELERQNERLERFASVVSHDLRNPLTVAQGHLDAAKTADDPASSIAEVEVSLDRMQELIEDVLALARQGRSVGEPNPVALASVAEQARETVETAAATVRIETTAAVMADESRVRQLFENLFRNAVEHSSTGPPSHAREDSVEHGSTGPPEEPGDAAERRDPGVTITVEDLPDGFAIEDDGPGIPDARKDPVFELGYTTEPDGTGFGLGIVSEIVDAHGWDVRITDGETGGARFEVTGVDRVDPAAPRE